jgi:lipopolysaccharide biosynthesis glycosyltransferase
MNSTKTTISIATTIDINYIQHLGVMLSSLFENNLKSRFKIYLIINFTENKELRKIQKLINRYNHQIDIIKVDESLLVSCKVTGHVTLATYYRLLIPNLINQTVAKVLYIDADIIIKNEIYELWNIVLDDETIVAAVEEPLFNRHIALGVPETAKYFNAGVMLINLVAWRQNDISTKAIRFIELNNERIMFWDQDVLNFLLYDKWLTLNPKWNVTTPLFTINADKLKMSENELNQILNQPNIIHFTGSSKPWHYLNTHPFKSEYYKYLKLTPWKNFKHPEETVWHQIKQSVKQLVNLIYGRKKFEVYN